MVCIEWVDSECAVGAAWHDLEETLKSLAETEDLTVCHSCGFLLYEDDNCVVLTMSHHGSECGPYIVIPAEAVRRTRDLNPRP